MDRKKKVRIAISALIAGFLVFPSVVTITTLQYDTSVQRVVMPSQSASAAYVPSNGLIYVQAYLGDHLYAYNSSTLQLQYNISTNGVLNDLFQPGQIYDAHNGLLYVSGLNNLAIINTTENSVVKTIYFGSVNFTQSMVLGSNGDLYVSQGLSITKIAGTEIVKNYSLENFKPIAYNDDVMYARDGYLNTSYFILMTSGELFSSSNLTHLNLSKVNHGQDFNNPTYMNYQSTANQLFVGTTDHLYVINPSNLSDTLFTINLAKSAGGVKTVTYSSHTGYLYVATYGSQAIRVFNDTTGSYIGALRQTDNYNTPTAIMGLASGHMAVSVGNRLIIENGTPSNLLPNFTDLWVAFAVSAAVVGPASVIVFLSFRRSK